MEGRRRVIFIDAANIGKAPGQFVRFTLDEVLLSGPDRHLNVHYAGLRDALSLAEALGTLPQEVVVFGVQPVSIEWDNALSPEVEAALPDLIDAVLSEISVSSRG
jgi:hydrogenase maturation protease